MLFKTFKKYLAYVNSFIMRLKNVYIVQFLGLLQILCMFINNTFEILHVKLSVSFWNGAGIMSIIA
jgi:hypothetical protein